MHHRVFLDGVIERSFLLGSRQFPIHQQITYFHEIALHRQLFDRIAAIKQNALIAVDKRYFGAAAGGGKKAGVVGKYAGSGVEGTNIHHIRPHGAGQDGKFERLAAVIQIERRCMFVVPYCSPLLLYLP